MQNDKELEQRNYKKKLVLRYEYDKNGGVALGHMIKNNFELFPRTPFPVNDMITNFGFLGRM